MAKFNLLREQNNDYNRASTLQLTETFIKLAKINCELKSQVSQNPEAFTQFFNNLTYSKIIWQALKNKTDFNTIVLNAMTSDGQSLAHWSLELMDNELTKDIHEFGKTFADSKKLSINYVDGTNRTTCFWSAIYKNKEIVQYCINNGAKITLTDSAGNKLYSVILSNGPEWRDVFISALVQDPSAFASDPAIAPYPIWKTLAKTAKSTPEGVLTSSVTPQIDKELSTELPTHLFDITNISLAANQPLPAGCLITSFLPHSMLPYFFACNQKALIMANKILISNPEFKDDHVDSKGWGHMHWVINLPDSLGKTKHIDILLEKGCNINLKDNEGKTPLHWSMYLSNKTIEHFLSKGADINSKDNQGYTPITIACKDSYGYRTSLNNIELSNKAANIAGYILKQAVIKGIKIDLEVRDIQNQSPFGHWLLEAHHNDQQNDELFKILKDLDYDFNKVDTGNKNIMDWVIDYKWKAAAKVLHDECGVNITQAQKARAFNDNDFWNFLNQLDSGEVEILMAGLNVSDSDIDDLYGM